MSKSIASLFRTDAALETEGINVDYGEYGSFKIARAGGKNQAFQNMMDRLMQPHRGQMRVSGGKIDDSIMESIMRKCFANTVILDWSLTDEEGQAIPFTPERCEQLLEDLPDLFLDLIKVAQDRTNFLAEVRAADAKP